jgi:hypothetical protein
VGDRLLQALLEPAVVEKAIETAVLMLGADKSRGYCHEMICADFLAGANIYEVEPSSPSTNAAFAPKTTETETRTR